MMLVTPQNSNPLYSEILCQVVKHQSWALESLKSMNPHWIKSHEDILALTKHLADVRLDVDVLEVLLGVGVVQPEGGVQPDRDPDAVTHPGHLADLRLLPETFHLDNKCSAHPKKRCDTILSTSYPSI